MKKLAEMIEKIILWPGNSVCNLLGVEGEDHRLILRAFVNLLFYSFVTLVLTLLFLV